MPALEAGRVLAIQDRHHALLQRAARATTDLIDAIGAAKKAGAYDNDLEPARTLHRHPQWRRDFAKPSTMPDTGQREAERTAPKK